MCNLPHATGRKEKGLKEKGLYIYYSPSQYSKAPAICEYIYFKEIYLDESDRNFFFALVLPWCGWVIFDHLQNMQNLTLKRMRNKNNYIEK